MNIAKKIGLAVVLTSASWAAQAANFGYNYGQIGYETGDFGGLTLTGSFEVNKDIFVVARYAALTNDASGIDIDYTDISIGAGYHMPINPKTDAVFTVSFDSAEIDVPDVTIPSPLPGTLPDIIIPGGTVDDTGILATAGVRHSLNAKVELAGGIYHVTTGDGDTGFQGEARYNINKDMSAALAFTSGDFIDGLSLNFRYGF